MQISYLVTVQLICTFVFAKQIGAVWSGSAKYAHTDLSQNLGSLLLVSLI